MNINKRIIRIVIAIVVIAIYGISTQFNDKNNSANPAPDNTLLRRAISNHNSDVQVTGFGTVSKVLPDDTRGSQHQRFLITLDTGERILIAHNIDLAPRIPDLKKGDKIGFNGEFEWNSKGGVLHWTHKDPRSQHIHGWLEHQGKKYW